MTAKKTAATPQASKATAQKVAYSIAAGAAAAAVGAEANAAVVYSGVQDLPIAQFSSQDLNLDGDAYNDILLKNYVFGGNYQGATVNFFPGKVVGFNAGLSYATALSDGDVIDAAATAGGPFAVSLAYGANPNSQFDNAVGAFLGLEFPINGMSHFGWIRVTIDNAGGTFVINDWAYNSTPGEGLLAGQIPEPGSLGLLAAGAAGVAALRRRRSS
ncbi:PEP-CTERM sorting domain-containing protein [Botrimarina hoheduenensis]|uniref:PEP-CTERM motif protein n=1 Tax=Botrimarina hoheduenensis TaxID=2528000 RepID=A0A5C5WD06_9BACT|nr:PEP-CTERM sorting domain-containing protein [Botrimarina hoheduenensis]TWT47552.1 PEP-CTERM motif protein [Botrimarina hoheduenensis]